MTYDWEFSALDCAIGPDPEGNQDIVHTIHWRLTARESGHSVSEYSTLGVTLTEGDPFVPFGDLTKSDVQGWCEAALDVDAIKVRLRAGIRLAQDPVNATLAPPWAPSP